MKINLFGYRNIMGTGIHFSSFSNVLRQYSGFTKLAQEWDPSSQERLLESLLQSNENDVNIWFSRSSAIGHIKGKNILWAMFESDKLPQSFLDPLLKADLVWTPSAWGREVLVANGLQAHKVDVIPLGVDPLTFHPFARKQVSDPVYRFLVVGKYEQRKGYDQLFEAFNKAFKNRSDVELLIKGDFFADQINVAHDLKNRVDTMGLENIKILAGAWDVYDMFSLYNYANGFVMPSRAEGWGLPLIEALACGLPSIAINYSGQTEFLGKIDGLYLPINYKIVPISDPLYIKYWPSISGEHGNWAEADVDDLATKMLNMVQNRSKYNDVGKMASEVIRTRFNWSKAVDAAIDSLKKNQLIFDS